MREENLIEVAISLLWNASIHFVFLPRMEGEIPLPYLRIYFPVCYRVNLNESCKKLNDVSAEKIKRFVLV